MLSYASLLGVDVVINRTSYRPPSSPLALGSCLAPSDYARHEQVKKEHRESIRTLKMTGSRAPDLDTEWLPPEKNDEDEDDDDDDDGLSIGGGGGGHGVGGSDDDLASDDSSDESLLVGDERLQQEGL